MKYLIKDFVDREHVEVEGWTSLTSCGEDGAKAVRPLVTLWQTGGSMRFHHSMTPYQARFMATALSMAADEAEEKMKREGGSHE